jgi:hypothetical protein
MRGLLSLPTSRFEAGMWQLFMMVLEVKAMELVVWVACFYWSWRRDVARYENDEYAIYPEFFLALFSVLV